GGPVGEARFVDVSGPSGLAAVGSTWTGAAPCVHEGLGGGAAVGDVDGDGDLDVFVPRIYLPSALMLNDGRGGFTPSPTWEGRSDGSHGATFADLDGDRDLDLVVTSIGASPNLLYVNDGAGGFTEEGAARGFAPEAAPGCGDWFGATAGDVDRDGDLDLIVAQWHEEGAPLAERTRLYVNDGAGAFSDQTLAWGFTQLWSRAVFSVLLADRDADGWPDLHVVADWGGTALYLNRGLAFVEAQPDTFTDENGMGGDFGDVERDGDLDWFVAAIWDDRPICPVMWGCSGNRLYVEDEGAFVDHTDAAGVRVGQWGWSAAFFDHDLDGALDLALTGGFAADGFVDEPGRLWRGRGTGGFDDVTCPSGWMHRGNGRGVIPFDADGDGDEDLLVAGNPDPPALWRNDGYEGRGWVSIDLDQPGPNRFALGARVTVRTGPGAVGQLRLVHANPTYVSGRPPLAHVGLGDHRGPVEVDVVWPDGVTTTFTGVGPGRVTLVRP
ncbi:MAG: CRTAC1 family protein, partial [Myxococcota bacterium]